MMRYSNPENGSIEQYNTVSLKMLTIKTTYDNVIRNRYQKIEPS